MVNSLKRVACLQMNSSDLVDDNLKFIEQSLQAELADGDPLDLVLLPENFAQMPANRHQQYAEQDGEGVVQDKLSELAQRFDTCIIGGSLAVNEAIYSESPPEDKKPFANQKPFARSLVYAKTGERLAHYDKLHLFDIDVPVNDDASPVSRYRESDSYTHGRLDEKALTTFVVPDAQLTIGLTICYDLRFAELYRALAEQGAQLITVPSAFTAQTGQAHWHALLRARAIENQVYILAAAQGGTHASGRQTYGHSLIIDPWGKVIAEKTAGEGLLIAEIDLSYIDKLKENFPINRHRRLV